MQISSKYFRKVKKTSAYCSDMISVDELTVIIVKQQVGRTEAALSSEDISSSDMQHLLV